MDEKIIFACLNCDQKIRFPRTETLIKFSCPECKRIYFAKNGTIINERDTAHETKTDLNENDNANNIIKDNSENKDNKDNIVDRKKTLTPVRKINIWKYSVYILGIAVIFCLIYILILKNEKTYSHINSEKFTENFISRLRKTKNRNFDELKVYLTDDTKKRFEIFIESQYSLKDSASMKMINKFINTLSPLNYLERRKFYWLNENNDSVFVNLNYVPVGDSFLIDVTTDELIK